MKTKALWAIAIGLVAATSLSGAVMAADITEAPQAFDWTGPYIGAHVGWGWIDLKGEYDTSDGTGDFVDDLSGHFDLDDNNILGGLQAGYNWQINQFVLGIEADVSVTDLHDKQTNDDNERVSFDTNVIASLRARAGFAMDNLLVYAIAGGALTDTTFEASDGGNDDGHTDLDDVGLSSAAGPNTPSMKAGA
jgi:outer membrane immunogenic protein